MIPKGDVKQPDQIPLHGRGASGNPPNRFEKIRYNRDPDWTDPDDPAPATDFLKDPSRSIITYNDSPDVGFRSEERRVGKECRL